MSFKENFIKKIRIDRLAAKIRKTIGSLESGRKIDKEAARALLAMTPLEIVKERDLELYVMPGESEKKMILVLDNDLPFYNTTISDVLIRKSPTVKEMISIKNAIKILNDKDVVKSKKEESLRIIQKMCIEQLDLSYDISHLENLEKEGIMALESEDEQGVLSVLDIFSEIIGFCRAPKEFKAQGFEIMGFLAEFAEKDSGEMVFGPFVVYGPGDNSLRWFEQPISGKDKEKKGKIRDIATYEKEPDKEGPGVFTILKNLGAKADYNPMKNLV